MICGCPENSDERPDTVGLIYSDVFCFQDRNVKFADIKYKNERVFQANRPLRGKVLKELSLNENFIPASTVVVRRLCFDKVGFFDEGFASVKTLKCGCGLRNRL